MPLTRRRASLLASLIFMVSCEKVWKECCRAAGMRPSLPVYGELRESFIGMNAAGTPACVLVAMLQSLAFSREMFARKEMMGGV